jgi:hypothetical protein
MVEPTGIGWAAGSLQMVNDLATLHQSLKPGGGKGWAQGMQPIKQLLRRRNREKAGPQGSSPPTPIRGEARREFPAG